MGTFSGPRPKIENICQILTLTFNTAGSTEHHVSYHLAKFRPFSTISTGVIRFLLYFSIFVFIIHLLVFIFYNYKYLTYILYHLNFYSCLITCTGVIQLFSNFFENLFCSYLRYFFETVAVIFTDIIKKLSLITSCTNLNIDFHNPFHNPNL